MSISGVWFMVTTSASRPAATDMACLLEPPCDWLTLTSCWCCCRIWALNAGLMSLYSSRDTSYDTFSKVWLCALAISRPLANAAARVLEITGKRMIHSSFSVAASLRLVAYQPNEEKFTCLCIFSDKQQPVNQNGSRSNQTDRTLLPTL